MQNDEHDDASKSSHPRDDPRRDREQRRHRPEVQIYRPGAFRGVEVIAKQPPTTAPPKASTSEEEPSRRQAGNNSFTAGENEQRSNNDGRRRGGRRRGRSGGKYSGPNREDENWNDDQQSIISGGNDSRTPSTWSLAGDDWLARQRQSTRAAIADSPDRLPPTGGRRGGGGSTAEFRRGRLSSVASSRNSSVDVAMTGNANEMLPPPSPRNYRMRQQNSRNFVSSSQSLFDRPSNVRQFEGNWTSNRGGGGGNRGGGRGNRRQDRMDVDQKATKGSNYINEEDERRSFYHRSNSDFKNDDSPRFQRGRGRQGGNFREANDVRSDSKMVFENSRRHVQQWRNEESSFGSEDGRRPRRDASWQQGKKGDGRYSKQRDFIQENDYSYNFNAKKKDDPAEKKAAVAVEQRQPEKPPLAPPPAPPLDTVRATFESLLRQTEEHFDWSSTVESELERKMEEERKAALLHARGDGGAKTKTNHENNGSTGGQWGSDDRLPAGDRRYSSRHRRDRRSHSRTEMEESVPENAGEVQDTVIDDRTGDARKAAEGEPPSQDRFYNRGGVIRAPAAFRPEPKKQDHFNSGKNTRSRGGRGGDYGDRGEIRNYEPTHTATTTTKTQVRNEKAPMYRSASETRSVAEQMASGVGAQIEALNAEIDTVLKRIAEDTDESAAERLLHLCERLSSLYESVVTVDMDYTYSMNLEQHLWKQCFYKPIEALKSGSNHHGDYAKRLRKHLILLIAAAQGFYNRLLINYETTFGFSYANFLYWPGGLPTDDLESGIPAIPEAGDRQVKLALLSLQRLLVAMGDLHRYDAVVGGIKDYSIARLWYLKSTQLAPTNGRSYNQLALLAVYAHRKMDIIFYYMRAMAARHPFDTARQPLYSAFDDLRKRVDAFEKELRSRVGDDDADAERAAAEADAMRPQEIWIAADGRPAESQPNQAGQLRQQGMANRLALAFSSSSTSELHRRGIAYLLHAAGLLVTKIGMERFEMVGSRAVQQLGVLLARDESPLTAFQLLQATTVCLFAVHNAALSESEPGTCSLQQQRAVQLVLSLWALMLEQVALELDNLESYLNGTAKPPQQLLRVLPSLDVIAEWLSTPAVNSIYRAMPSLEAIDVVAGGNTDTWKLLARVCNTLSAIDARGGLAATPAQDERDDRIVELTLPENVLTASFCDVFVGQPKTTRLICSRGVERGDLALLALHARLRALLAAAEYLDGSGLPCFEYDEQQHCFTAPGGGSVTVEDEGAKIVVGRRRSAPSDEENSSEGEGDAGDGESSLRRQLKERLMKQDLMARESVRRRVVIEVRPTHLVVDTNAFIDHLGGLRRIVASKKYTICIPTIVLSELTGLSLPPSPSLLAAGNTDEEWAGPQAKCALAFLKEFERNRSSQVCTISSKGNRLPAFTFALEQFDQSIGKKTADDLILATCVALAAGQSSDATATTGGTNDESGQMRLRRNVVLMTEDRGLAIKAVSANVPVCTVPGFLKWSAL